MILSIYAVLAFIVYLLLRNCSRPKRFPPGKSTNLFSDVVHTQINGNNVSRLLIKISGPPLLPLIGTWYCLPSVPVSKDVAAWRKKYGNVIGHKLGFRYIVFVTGREEIIAGAKHPNLQARSSSEFFKKRTFGKRLGSPINK